MITNEYFIQNNNVNILILLFKKMFSRTLTKDKLRYCNFNKQFRYAKTKFFWKRIGMRI